ncbi:MAG: NAD(P)H-hydrate dehydratase [Halorhodospira halophila]|uniref:NAD(P)H-hydrate dehydratase n=1 Tax=Halorhodospira TaxID=85108 RepID=UPI001EE8BD4E|nr:MULTISPECIES: NAD(P)H-hydrate dehydratase [Halorhodospira]MCC3751153.1 NAD(P)H-hydrate dehydratase [Halorhodospira halophila]MCG5528562.1 NAD(P)H-hydrate dehydratase [Halorhodospira halophila]MCG5543775.1 NAD(P)H-hydrate dehydratase [Halorhodospira sp. 9628]
MRELYTPDQVARLDQAAIRAGIAGEVLMDRAGRRLWQEMRQRWPGAGRLAVVCGGGNNGGDGYVVARLAGRAGLAVEVLYLVPPERLSGDAARHAQRYLDGGGICRPFEPEALDGVDVIVDALLGTGLDRPVSGAFAEAVTAVNATPAPVASVDIPSGIHGRTGAEMGVAVRAQLTATFVARKSGLFTGRGPACAGAVVFDDLGTATWTAGAELPHAWQATPADVGALLPPRPRDAHKGQQGHVLVVGGDRGMAGAVRLAAEAAGRSGAGLVSVATRPEHVPAVVGPCPAVMAHGIDRAEELAPLLSRASVVALGPGLGQGAWGRAMWAACRDVARPRVVDADGLNLLAADGRPLADAVLTPHPGEAARLLGADWDTTAIAADRFAAVRELASGWQAVALLKGAGTLVDDGRARYLASAGTPGMASGGMGDVLTGVVAGLWAQCPGADRARMAAVAAHVHGRAGERAAAALGGERGLLASDLLGWLPAVLAEGEAAA